MNTVHVLTFFWSAGLAVCPLPGGESTVSFSMPLALVSPFSAIRVPTGDWVRLWRRKAICCKHNRSVLTWCCPLWATSVYVRLTLGRKVFTPRIDVHVYCRLLEHFWSIYYVWHWQFCEKILRYLCETWFIYDTVQGMDVNNLHGISSRIP